MRKFNCVVLLAAAMLLGGCNILEWPLYVLFGQSTSKVKAEYTGLKNQRIAIIVATGPGINFEYPYARTNVALASAQVISKHVKKAQFVDQDKIEAFQMENLSWATLPVETIALKFNATRILYLDLYHFTMHEENSVHLLRGQIRSSARIYEIDGDGKVVYQTEISVKWPKHGPRPMSEATLARLQMETIVKFAERLARKFYDHKASAK